MDNRTREHHRKLNGQIFRFDDPPIIDERTGQRGLPAETYNCRCTMTPIIDKDYLKRRRELYKAQNSLVNKIKKVLNTKIL